MADHGRGHQHDEGCVAWNLDEWALLDLPLAAEDMPIERHDFWRLRVALKRPPHVIEMMDYAGQWLLGSLADEIAQSHVIHYHLLLKGLEGEREGNFERVGLFVKRVPLRESEYRPGELSKVTII